MLIGACGLTAPAFLARWAAEEMERHGGGVIVNVGSMMARQARGVSPAYYGEHPLVDVFCPAAAA